MLSWGRPLTMVGISRFGNAADEVSVLGPLGALYEEDLNVWTELC